MGNRQIVILGGPGSGAVFADAIRDLAAAGEAIELLGFLNDTVSTGSELCGVSVLGRFEDWRRCPREALFISAIPQAKQAWARYRRILSLDIPSERWASIVHPRAQVARGVSIRPGSYVGPLAIVETGSVLGSHVCLRGGCYISHDVTVGDYVFIGPNASILGRASLDDGVHAGANAVCREEISVGRYAVVGVGAAVVDDVADFMVVAGVPAKVIGRAEGPAPTCDAADTQTVRS